MYGKLFDSMYDSTLAEDWRALVTFQQMIVLCDADGMIDMTPQSLARRTSIPIEHIEAGIKILENPDPYSRTPDQEGRRIELIDEHRPWGWHIVNHEKYKNLQDADTIRAQTRERVRKHREMKRTVTDSNASKRHIDTDINKDKEKRVKKTFTPPSLEDIKEYANSRNSAVDPKSFYDYFDVSNWIDGNGNKVKNWKQKFISWDNRTNKTKTSNDFTSNSI